MSASVVLDGFDELVQALTNAPKAIRDEAFPIVRKTTEAAAAEIRAVYSQHTKTGNLANRVRTAYPSSTVIVGIVQSTSPHSHLFEFGTKPRTNARGANRGVMPAHKTTPAIAARHRAQMYQELREMLARLGFTVSG